MKCNKLITMRAVQAITKYPVIAGRKECSVCGFVKCVEENFYSQMSKTGKRYYRGECKSCLNSINVMRQLERKIDKYPMSYKYCASESCNWIYGVQHKNCTRCGC